jgi:hypothetical protein
MPQVKLLFTWFYCNVLIISFSCGQAREAWLESGCPDYFVAMSWVFEETEC